MSKANKRSVVDWRALTKLEKKVFADERGGIMHRWEYGREVLKAKAGRKQLPDGVIAQLIKAAGTKVDRNGNEKPKISEREIRNRVRLAEVYTDDQQVGKIIADLETWSAIIEAGFPPVEIPDRDLLDLIDAMEVEPPDSWEQLTLLPGFKPMVKVGGREVRFDFMTVPEAIAYRDKVRSMHDSFGKTVDLIEATVDAIIDGWDGDPETKAVDAYQIGAGDKPPP